MGNIILSAAYLHAIIKLVIQLPFSCDWCAVAKVIIGGDLEIICSFPVNLAIFGINRSSLPSSASNLLANKKAVRLACQFTFLQFLPT